MAVAVVLAGRRNRGALQGVSDAEWEALIPLAGRPMAAHVVAALRGAGVEDVIVVGPPGVDAGATSVPAGEDLVGTLRAGLEAAAGCDEVLLAAGDAPLLTAAAVRQLVEVARSARAGFAYPIVSRSLCEASFPGVHRTYVRLREGAFTGGNCLYVRRPADQAVLRLASAMYGARKRPWRLAGMLGWGLLLHLVLGTARIAEAEAAAARLLGCRATAVIAQDAGIGVDVDKPSDLELCRRHLSSR